MSRVGAVVVGLVLLATPAHAQPSWDDYKQDALKPLVAPPRTASTLPQWLAFQIEKDEMIAQARLRFALVVAVWDAAETVESNEPNESSTTPTLFVDGPYAIPTYIVMCESGGNYLAENDHSTASGAYQILDSTWAGFGGYYHAADAPPRIQDQKAALLWADGAGAAHWENCL